MTNNTQEIKSGLDSVTSSPGNNQLVENRSTITLIILAYHSYQINFSMTMDNNTLEAVKSINWSAIPK
jgi:hypothetical protein